uniref:Amidase domain-containing protein n=1 Tax=Aegilops tauschii subsp. strangulata TaxID=200361 RepID=A0A453JV47_AEGTS
MRTTALPPTPALPPHPQRLLQWLGRRRRCQSHRLRPGTDSCGSVRVPAAYCGIFGLYPSHGLVSTQMFKTVGNFSLAMLLWFARDLATLSCVTDVLMPPVRADASDAELRRPSHVIIPADYLKILGSMEDRTYEILNASAAKVFGNDTVVNNGNIGDFVSSNVPSIGKFMTDLSAVEASSSCVPSLSAISRVMRVLQWSEFKTNHAEWVNIVKPNLGPGIRERV